MIQKKKTLIFACGNPSRGDDALGPALIEQMSSLLKEQGIEGQFELLSDFQFQIEHVLDMKQRDRVIFVDASVSVESPFSFEKLQLPPDRSLEMSYTTHALHPNQLLPVYRHYFHEPPPPCYLLSIRGHAFELGMPLSNAAKEYLEQAIQFLLGFLT